MSKHTPGPWAVRRWSWPTQVEGSIHQVISADSFPTAFVPAWDKPEPGEVEAGDEARANARLIAAAPELLEACKLIVSAFDALKPASAARNEPLQINAARAAIAKAEGRA